MNICTQENCMLKLADFFLKKNYQWTTTICYVLCQQQQLAIQTAPALQYLI